MTTIQRTMAAFAVAALSTSLFTPAARADETLQYDWHLRGVLSWFARVKFPTSGIGLLQTSSHERGVQSQLRVDAGGKDYIEYLSVIDPSMLRTLASTNGYTFGSKSERKETKYDYASDVAIVSKQGEPAAKSHPLTSDAARDVLTTIAYLRANAASITAPVMTQIFSDGKPYPAVIKPAGLTTMQWQGRNVNARAFTIAAAPGAQKKLPGVSVWLSDDAQHLPLRIVLDQQFASVDMRLKSL